MTVELSADDLAYVEDLVRTGRFSSADEAVHAAMSLLISAGDDPVWSRSMQAAVDAGVVAQQQSDLQVNPR